jgi:hypothetical protein
MTKITMFLNKPMHFGKQIENTETTLWKVKCISTGNFNILTKYIDAPLEKPLLLSNN